MSSRETRLYTLYIGGETYKAIATSRGEAESAFVAYITRKQMSVNLLCCGLNSGEQMKFGYWVMISAQTMKGREYPIASGFYRSIMLPTKELVSRYRNSRELRMSLNALSTSEGLRSLVFRELLAGSLKKFVWEDSCPWKVYAPNTFPNVMAFHRGLLPSHRIRSFEPRALLELRVLDDRLLDHREPFYT